MFASALIVFPFFVTFLDCAFLFLLFLFVTFLDCVFLASLFICMFFAFSGSLSPFSPGTTTSKVAKYLRRQDIINRKKKKKDEDNQDSEQKVRKGKTVKSGTAAMNGIGSKQSYGGLGSRS